MNNLIIKLVTLVLCTLIVAGSGCTINKQNKLAEMVKAGEDPQKAACAIYYGETVVCAIIAVKEQ